MTTLEFFTSTQWEFTNDNIYGIINEMNEIDNKVSRTKKWNFFLSLKMSNYFKNLADFQC